ncbi:hypothetical protein R3P38DRAFT_3425795, partial [Favolaschia claudopus]
IFPNAIKEGWGASKLLSQLRLAADWEYIARNYTPYEIDLAILIYELGGNGALYALNHSIFALPSRNTIQPYRRQRRIIPSVDKLRITDVSANITAMYGDHSNSEPNSTTPSRCGHSLSLDELAMEREISVMEDTDKMAGFCLEHLKSSGLQSVKIGPDIAGIQAAVDAVREGRVHIAHEACVAAISRLAGTKYGAKPIYIGPTCKKSSWQETMRTIQILVEAWKRSPDGERKNGPLFSVSTDGCPLRRRALFMLCMHDEIRPGNPIYEYVKNLPGLNLRVGANNLTADSDYKHEFKRIRGDLCSNAGMVIKNVCVNRELLSLWLERLPDHDWSETSIHALLDPADGQNVSKAIKLLLCIAELGKLDLANYDPSEGAELEALSLLGEMFHALLEPFINVRLSLSEQIESLVRFSHLLCALYMQNGTSFMSNQLYSDLQTMVKNAILTVPKVRLINGRLKVYICLLGDDVLEALFGRCRMIGGHSPNCNVCQLRDRLASAMNLDSIFESHPELERKPERLKLMRMRDLDHIRPSSFAGELSADSCDLQMCWSRAVSNADKILLKYGVKMPLSFAKLFQQPNTDLMRPFGGKYPAISSEVDRSMASPRGPIPALPASALDSAGNPRQFSLNIDFDSMLAEEASAQEMPPHTMFAKIDDAGHLTHKKSVVRELFDMTHDNHSSHDRLHRIRGYTIGGKSWNREGLEQASLATHFSLGNIFSTVICYNQTHLGIAIGKCTGIKNGPPNSKSPSLPLV